jgi:hypothetical protein
MSTTPDHARTVLVLGAYGLAGRAIVRRLIEKTEYDVVAAGRNPERLRGLADGLANSRLQTRILDATDPASLRQACASVGLVINAVGPYARYGAAIARVVVECGRTYVDCANEQLHYRRLSELESRARRAGIAMVTAAGAIPGLSTLLMAYLLERFPQTTGLDCCWAQFRHAYADSGLGSMMGGILEAVDRPVALSDGQAVPVVIGRSTKSVTLPEPFGKQRLLEVPVVDELTIPQRFPLHDMHTWIYMGELPTWLLGVIRLLKPHRRPWAYRFIEFVMRRINDRDTRKAIAAGVGPEALLMVSAHRDREARTRHMLFRDGAVATACLPVCIADRCLRGECEVVGLLTPLDLVKPAEVLTIADDALLHVDLESLAS